MKNKQIYLVLDNVRYKNNLGPIMRIVDAFDIRKLFVCIKTRDAFNPDQLLIIKKVSRGVSEYIDWQLVHDSLKIVQELKANGVKIVSIDLSGLRNISDAGLTFEFPIALVFGHEGHGIDPEILNISDEIFKIPMFGRGNSLNVASSVAIVAYKIRELSS